MIDGVHSSLGAMRRRCCRRCCRGCDLTRVGHGKVVAAFAVVPRAGWIIRWSARRILSFLSWRKALGEVQNKWHMGKPLSKSNFWGPILWCCVELQIWGPMLLLLCWNLVSEVQLVWFCVEVHFVKSDLIDVVSKSVFWGPIWLMLCRSPMSEVQVDWFCVGVHFLKSDVIDGVAKIIF